MAGRIARDAVSLPWLPPSPAGLEALLRPEPDSLVLRHDPALLLHRLRFFEAAGRASPVLSLETAWDQPLLCLAAARGLQATASYYSWQQTPAGQHWHRQGLRLAYLAWHVAQRSGRCSPDAAWTAGLLAPLGWYAVAATDPLAAAAAHADPDWLHEPTAVEQRAWGASAQGIARRLSRRWRLPAWITIAIGWPELPEKNVIDLGGSPELLAVLTVSRTVLKRTTEATPTQPLTVPAGLPMELMEIALSESAHAFALADTAMDAVTPANSARSHHLESPIPRRWLASWLRSVARERQARLDRAETERWQEALAAGLQLSQQQFQDTVNEAKLVSLAEFAAGASHEINNPLAVISGNAQLLRAGETDPQRRRRLDTIIRSSQRIHDLLHSTRQFARPTPPRKQWFDLACWLTTEQIDVAALVADEPSITVEWIMAGGEEPIWVHADPEQLRIAIQQVVRNAIEASRGNGPVRIRLDSAGDQAEVIVEDSGPGPEIGQIPHLFDPFYCGRSAGRRVGLGLSVAWRLMKENDGQLRYAPSGSVRGRFVLQIPRHADGFPEQRKSA